MTTPAARALLSEMHPCEDRDNAHSTPGGTWHMSTNRMGSMLSAVEQQAIERAAGVRVTGDAGPFVHPRLGVAQLREATDPALLSEAAGVRVTGDAGLDVDRLARALRVYTGWVLCDSETCTDHGGTNLAAAIAREYAALAMGDEP